MPLTPCAAQLMCVCVPWGAPWNRIACPSRPRRHAIHHDRPLSLAAECRVKPPRRPTPTHFVQVTLGVIYTCTGTHSNLQEQTRFRGSPFCVWAELSPRKKRNSSQLTTYFRSTTNNNHCINVNIADLRSNIGNWNHCGSDGIKDDCGSVGITENGSRLVLLVIAVVLCWYYRHVCHTDNWVISKIIMTSVILIIYQHTLVQTLSKLMHSF